MKFLKVLHDYNLTSTEKVIFIEIYMQNKIKLNCTMTNSELGCLLDLSSKTISRSLSKLHRMNYITVFNEGSIRIVRVNKN